MKSLIWFFVALMTAGMLPFDSAVASVEEQHECQVEGLLNCRYNTVSEWEYDGCVEQVRASCRRFAPSSSSSSPSEISPRSSSENSSGIYGLPAGVWLIALPLGFFLLLKFFIRFGGALGTQTSESKTPVKSNTPRKNARKRKDTPNNNDYSSYRLGGRTPEFVVKRDYPADCIVCGTNTRRLSENGKCVECINL